MLLPYNYYNHVMHNLIRKVYSLPNDVEFNIVEYIKSQIHSPLLANHYDRPLVAYINALKLIEGDMSKECVKDFKTVLRYFYRDVCESIKGGTKEEADSDFNFNIVCGKSYAGISLVDIPKDLSWQDKIKMINTICNSSEIQLVNMR